MTKKKKPEIQLIEELSFEEVIENGRLIPGIFFGSAKRLKIFRKIGYCCISCDRKATKLKKYRRLSDNSLFWSICSKDDVEMTIDHIIPKSLGGKNEIDNFQPMCMSCNIAKGNGLRLVSWNKKLLVSGNEVWIKERGSKRIKYKGIIDKVDINPYSGKKEVFVVSERGSSYKLNKRLLIQIPVDNNQTVTTQHHQSLSSC
jgi:hypothetical protein